MKVVELAHTVSALSKRVDEQSAYMHSQFEFMHKQFDFMHGQFDFMHKQFDYMHEKFDQIDHRFDSLEDLVRGLYGHIDSAMYELKTQREELAAHGHRVDRHERWIGKLADRADIKLES